MFLVIGLIILLFGGLVILPHTLWLLLAVVLTVLIILAVTHR